jgi:DNA-binding response OmpR family regulator
MIKASRKLTEKATDFYDDGLLRIEYDSYYATWKGELIRLSRSEFFIISRLVQSRERFVSSRELWITAWGKKKKYNDESMRACMSKLRHHFAPLGMKIENMAGVGYRFVPHGNFQ